MTPKIRRRDFLSLFAAAAAQQAMPGSAFQGMAPPVADTLSASGMADFVRKLIIADVDKFAADTGLQSWAANWQRHYAGEISREEVRRLNTIQDELAELTSAQDSAEQRPYTQEEFLALEALLKIVFGEDIHQKLGHISSGKDGSRYRLGRAVIDFGENTASLSLNLVHTREDGTNLLHFYEAALSLSDPQAAQHVYYLIHEKPGQTPHVSLAGRKNRTPAADIVDFGRTIRFPEIAARLEVLLKDYIALNAPPNPHGAVSARAPKGKLAL